MQSTQASTSIDHREEISDPVKVLYLGGQLRSGSTLLGRLMGEVAGCANIGEVIYIWNPYVQERLCGCGTPLKECGFWNDVFREAFGGFDQVDRQEMMRTRRELQRIKTLPRLLSPMKTTACKKRIEVYIANLDALYVAMRKVSGARVIVDGSKSPLYAYFLGRAPSIDLRVAHLVRDSRAVAFSYQRRKKDPAIHWKDEEIGTVHPARVALEWTLQNMLTRPLARRANRYAFMRYEDAVRDPRAAISRLCALIDQPDASLSFLDGPEIHLRAHHTVTGNPDRFQPVIRIRVDDEWKAKMRTSQRGLVTAMTLPLLLGYGYGGKD